MAKMAVAIKSKRIILMQLAKAIAFVLISALLLTAASNVFIPKQNIRENGINYFNARGFYGEPTDSLDIIAIGNSNLYSAFSPMVLWRDHGYASYVSGEARQTMAEAYKVLQEALSCQSPKLLILETDSIFEGGYNAGSLEITLTNFAQNTFPVFEFHNRWKSLGLQDFREIPQHTWKSKSKGFGISNKTDPYLDDEYMIPTDEMEQIKLLTLKSLNKIVDLCEEKRIKLILVEMPSTASWNYKKHNAVADFANKNKLTFIDLNLGRDSFGFNWHTDTRDKGNHLNCSGAEKVTKYLGTYISSNFMLPDHRNNPDYADSWNQALEDYTKKVIIV